MGQAPSSVDRFFEGAKVTPREPDDRIDVPFSVPFVHRLSFTDDVFGTDQQVLADLLEPSPGQLARVQFWVDQNVAELKPIFWTASPSFPEPPGQDGC
jgi:3-dehydroquinate synthase